MSRGFLILLMAMMLLIPVEGDGQNKQRNKTKTKTTTTTKKTTGNKQKSSNSGKKTTTTVNPKTSAEAKKKQAEAQKDIQLTEAQIKENEIKVSKGLSELGKIDQQIEKTTSEINILNGQLQKLQGEISTLENGINKNEKDLEKLREEYLIAVKKMRVTRKNKSALAFIFSSKNMSQALRRMRYMREFSKWREKQTEEINGKIIDLKSQRESLAKARDEQQDALSLQKKNEATLTNQKEQQSKVVAQLKENGKALESHLKRKQLEAKELGNMVSQLIAQEEAARLKAEEAKRKAEEEARRKAAEEAKNNKQENIAKNQESGAKNKKETSNGKEENTKSKDTNGKGQVYADARKRAPRGGKTQDTGSGDQISGDEFISMKGKLPYPSSGSFVVTSRFGRQHLPDLPNVEYDNPGIDAESDAGANARAVFEGKVSGVYLLPGYNTVVIVNHGNYYTVYGNISNASVKVGDNVNSGTTLGKLALSEEDSSRSSIHFEVWKNREKLNPLEWLR